MIVIKPEVKIMYCEKCETWTPQGLIYAVMQYICGFCGYITLGDKT